MLALVVLTFLTHTLILSVFNKKEQAIIGWKLNNTIAIMLVRIAIGLSITMMIYYAAYPDKFESSFDKIVNFNYYFGLVVLFIRLLFMDLAIYKDVTKQETHLKVNKHDGVQLNKSFPLCVMSTVLAGVALLVTFVVEEMVTGHNTLLLFIIFSSLTVSYSVIKPFNQKIGKFKDKKIYPGKLRKLSKSFMFLNFFAAVIVLISFTGWPSLDADFFERTTAISILASSVLLARLVIVDFRFYLNIIRANE